MSKEKLQFQRLDDSPDGASPDSAHENSENAQRRDTDRGLLLRPALRRLASRRLWPVYVASLTTLMWLGGIAMAAYRAGILLTPGILELPELSALIGGMAAPVAVIWLIALVYQRTDPLLERRIEMVQGMDRQNT